MCKTCCKFRAQDMAVSHATAPAKRVRLMPARSPVVEDEVVINEESDVTELAEKRRRRAPEKYSPTWFMDSNAIAFMREVDAARSVSEGAHRFIAVDDDNYW